MPGKKNSLKHTILVVDDQVGIVSFLHDFFSQKGYAVLQATSGNSALQIIKKKVPQIILLDIKLGWGKDGIEVLKEIKKIAPHVKVLMMTSIADEDVIEKAFDLGAEDYIVKPFSLSYLEKIVMLKILNLEIKNIGTDTNEDRPEKNI
ncbi:MAG: response regulator [Candidatus Omnitrophota bacterium]